eukprot:1434603-Prymnesium_polylepis.1
MGTGWRPSRRKVYPQELEPATAVAWHGAIEPRSASSGHGSQFCHWTLSQHLDICRRTCSPSQAR